ncbi:bifunctional CDT1 Geminin-binding domain-like/Winged helix DNA-binding domain superfamily [Babesia duncani]|uniref:Bifunctional CDT1 Geminin-binding domain-like/Winged helix DNA-binding domain superfamily n=1 Tax=Babesia duncani TaxID=323732 RepID=A0AAD9PKU8_9APIC|nr:bifunctional CDT1 Geminin-binding domain-like/Winged helix DNA-binding domain superfamily [Babesia duncani]
MECLIPKSAFKEVDSPEKYNDGDSTRCKASDIDGDAMKSIIELDLPTPFNAKDVNLNEINEMGEASPTSTPRNSIRKSKSHKGIDMERFMVSKTKEEDGYLLGKETPQGEDVHEFFGMKGDWQAAPFVENFLKPCLNVSEDESKNPILASSIKSARRMVRTASGDAEMEQSIRVLGNSRCWTDRYEMREGENVLNDEEQSEDELLAVQSPIRSLDSYVKTPCPLISSSMKAIHPGLGKGEGTPLGTPSRSGMGLANSTLTPKRYSPKSFNAGNACDLNDFNGATLSSLRDEPVNLMANARVPKKYVMQTLNGDLGMLYTHFKNICIVLRRCAIRDNHSYFKIVQLLVQRMSRKSFTMEHIRQMAWLAPNLISVKWVTVSERLRKKHATEYKECRSDVVRDLDIRVFKCDGKNYCANTTDFENSCLRFKTTLCGWVCRCQMELGIEGDLNDFDCNLSLPIPMVELPSQSEDEGLASAIGTPTRSVSRLNIHTPVSVSRISSRRSLVMDCGDEMEFKSPVKGIPAPLEDASVSTKRSHVETMSPMSLDLLDTPGMRRIKENVKKQALGHEQVAYSKEHDVKYWKDMQWFIGILVDMALTDNQSPIMRLDFLAEFMAKYASRKVTMGLLFSHVMKYCADELEQWASTLAEIAPNVVDKSISKFDDYATILTIGSASFEDAKQFVNDKIQALSQA